MFIHPQAIEQIICNRLRDIRFLQNNPEYFEQLKKMKGAQAL
jgi:hypothetical protein